MPRVPLLAPVLFLLLVLALAADPARAEESAAPREPRLSERIDLATAAEPPERLVRDVRVLDPDARLASGACGCAGDPCAGPFSGDLGLAIGLADGNTDRFDLRVDAHAAYERGRAKWSGGVDYAYGESGGDRITDHWHASARADLQLGGGSHAFAEARYESDGVAGLDYRVHGLAGYGLTLWRAPTAELKGEVGGGVVLEHYLGRPATEAPSAYLGFDFCRKWADGSELTASVDYLPNLDDFDLTSTILEAKYAKPIAKQLDLVVSLRVENVIDPPGGRDDTDLFLNLGLRLRL